MAERVGFGHRYSPAGEFVDPVSAPVAPPTFESISVHKFAARSTGGKLVAERVGFEPTKGLLPYLVSSEALSATQPSLRIEIKFLNAFPPLYDFICFSRL